MFNGIDISVHNGYVDFAKIAGAGYDFVMIRDGYGDLLSYPSQKDGRFEENYTRAVLADRHVGAYHYLYATDAAGARREAEGFLANLKGKRFDMPIALDIEERCQYNLSNAAVESIVKAFMDVCENAGYYCVLYSCEAFLRDKMSAAFRSSYDVWCANISCQPSIPYGIWQFSFTGAVPGCSGAVDLNRTERDYPKMIVGGGFNGFPKDLPELDSRGNAWYYFGMDKTPEAMRGLYAVKQRMKALGYGYLDDTGGFGVGTERAVNGLLAEWGYKQNGVIGKKFVERVMRG